MKTLNIQAYKVDNISIFSRKGLQSVFKISRKYFRQYLISCGLDPDDKRARFTESDGVLICTLQLFLSKKKGRKGHTINQFKQVVANNLVGHLCEKFNLEPQKKWRELLNEYQSRKN